VTLAHLLTLTVHIYSIVLLLYYFLIFSLLDEISLEVPTYSQDILYLKAKILLPQDSVLGSDLRTCFRYTSLHKLTKLGAIQQFPLRQYSSQNGNVTEGEVYSNNQKSDQQYFVDLKKKKKKKLF
jgi:hypothetical protein